MSASSIPSEFSIAKHWQTDRRGPIRWIISHLRRHWIQFTVMIIGATGNAGLAALTPVLMGRAFNDITAVPTITKNLLWIALLIGGSQILQGALQFGRNFGAEVIAQRIERNIRDELYTSLLGKSMTFHSLQAVGDTMARATNDVREVNYMFSPGLNLVIGSAIFMIMPIILAPTYHPSLIIVPLLYMVSYILALWQYLRELEPVTTNVRQKFGQLNTRLAEAIDGIETVKGLAQECTEVDRFIKNADQFRKAFIRQGDIEARFIPLLLLAGAEAFGFLHAVLLFRQGSLNIGDVVAYFGLIQLFGFPTFASLFAYSQVSLGIAGARRILELINRETNLDQNVTGYTGEMKGDVQFEGVTFSYGGETTLEDITFKVKAGQTVAIVGQTGAGKTSLAMLINRTYDVQHGQVCVDGVDVRDWNLETLRRKVSIIEQDVFLFSRSIAENISFGNSQATQEEIENAAKAAQAHEFILSFAEGYQTVIGERGVTLSGGQRQRIALARAFLTNPSILILDDSTSSIDSATEDKIQRAIFAAARGRTTFLITHRLSQIRWADLIIVMRKGRIAAIGDHAGLMKTSEAYRQIFSE